MRWRFDRWCSSFSAKKGTTSWPTFCASLSGAGPTASRSDSIWATRLQALKEFDESAACFQAAIRLAPDSPDAHNGLGIALASLENYDEAVSCYRRYLELRPDDPDVYANLGSACKGRIGWAKPWTPSPSRCR